MSKNVLITRTAMGKKAIQISDDELEKLVKDGRAKKHGSKIYEMVEDQDYGTKDMKASRKSGAEKTSKPTKKKAAKKKSAKKAK